MTCPEVGRVAVATAVRQALASSGPRVSVAVIRVRSQRRMQFLASATLRAPFARSSFDCLALHFDRSSIAFQRSVHHEWPPLAAYLYAATRQAHPCIADWLDLIRSDHDSHPICHPMMERSSGRFAEHARLVPLAHPVETS